MGRGRQKAKQTKVARELKYSIYEPNYKALEQELTSVKAHDDDSSTSAHPSWVGDDEDDEDDER